MIFSAATLFNNGSTAAIFWYCQRHAGMAIWMGVTTVRKEVDSGQLDVQGDKAIASAMQQWLGLSPFAKEKSRLAA